MRLTEDQLSQIEARFKAQNKVKVHESVPHAEKHALTGRQNGSKRSQIGPRASNKAGMSSDKDYWARTLQKQCRDAHLPVPSLEYRFHETRRWRFDCAWRIYPHDLAVEIEGGIWTQGRHIRGKGFLADCEKYNEAARLGWQVFRFTPNQVKMRVALEFMKAVLMSRGGHDFPPISPCDIFLAR